MWQTKLCNVPLAVGRSVCVVVSTGNRRKGWLVTLVGSNFYLLIIFGVVRFFRCALFDALALIPMLLVISTKSFEIRLLLHPLFLPWRPTISKFPFRVWLFCFFVSIFNTVSDLLTPAQKPSNRVKSNQTDRI